MPDAPRRILAALLVLGATVASCGKKGDPQPPLRRSPQPPPALAVAQRGDRVVVSLTAPQSYTDGSRLPVLDVELLRADRPGEFTKLAQTRRLRAAPGERLAESEPVPAPGTQLRYAARVLAKGKASALTGVTALTVQPPPAAPSDLMARRTPSGLTLRWTAPPRAEAIPEPSPATDPSPAPPPAPLPAGEDTASAPMPTPSAASVPDATPSSIPDPAASSSPTGSPSPIAATSGFWVYRRPANARYGEPLSPAPFLAPPFEDAETVAETVCYVVRTVVSTDPVIESADSNEVCVPPEMPAPSPGAGY